MDRVNALIQEMRQEKEINLYLSEVEAFITTNYEGKDQEDLFEAVNLVLESDKFESFNQKLEVIDNLLNELYQESVNSMSDGDGLNKDYTDPIQKGQTDTTFASGITGRYSNQDTPGANATIEKNPPDLTKPVAPKFPVLKTQKEVNADKPAKPNLN